MSRPQSWTLMGGDAPLPVVAAVAGGLIQRESKRNPTKNYLAAGKTLAKAKRGAISKTPPLRAQRSNRLAETTLLLYSEQRCIASAPQAHKSANRHLGTTPVSHRSDGRSLH